MNKIAQGMKQFLNDEEGVTAIEYGLIAALIAVFIIGALQAVGGSLQALFNAVSAALTAAL
ncbi:Flp family type IVb pilin [Nitrosospira multiformis]|uniref:Flp family type IVb pilin n=1 Tax=Nitrosospira multiformis TaxID=1231 RepID=UPI0008997BCB|nr:Flp family type IVb pilin [Nitrosospira multiformis]SEA44506.1 pilus assembly protein Flp/PilA [Nitrosospira multiformis]